MHDLFTLFSTFVGSVDYKDPSKDDRQKSQSSYNGSRSNGSGTKVRDDID
jgi:hypothetical protein